MEGLNLRDFKVLYVDDQRADRQQFLQECNGRFAVLCAEDVQEAESLLQREDVRVLISDNRMPLSKGMPIDDCCGLLFLKKVRERYPHIVRALVTGVPEECRSMPFELMNEAGVERWIDKLEKSPWDQIVQELVEKGALENLVRDTPEESRFAWFPGVVGESRVLRDLLSRIERICDTGLKSPILIMGESGTGKELVAAAIHRRSRWRNGPYHVISKVETLGDTARDALFGHAKGAFYGADASKPGAFEMAHGGTLLIDDVQNLSLDVQADLLRVIELGTFKRLGAGEKERGTDFQLICTTNEDPEWLVRQRRLREDFYHRINSLPLKIPPLRDRKEQIPTLVRRFIQDFNREAHTYMGDGKAKHVRGIDPAAYRALLSYDWRKNNVRELKNTIMSAWISASRDIIQTEDLPSGKSFFHILDTQAVPREASPWRIFEDYMGRFVEQAQVNLILWAHILSGGSTREAAVLLAITDNPESSRVRLHQIMKRHLLHDFLDRRSKEILYGCQTEAEGDADKGGVLLAQRLGELCPLLPEQKIDGTRYHQIVRRFKLGA